jgi:MerR family transcriptional regulator, thiopeptide resistance regulator
MAYTVKQLSSLAGVSARTLHYYDQIGMLKPTTYGGNGYRYYDEEAALRLQQILFFREMDFSLEEIMEILARPDFDRQRALQEHRAALQQRVKRLENLIQTIDKTIHHLKGEQNMRQHELFDGFSDEKQKEYAEEVRRKYGPDATRESDRLWASYSAEQKKTIMAEGKAVYNDLADAMEAGMSAESGEVQKIVARWHEHLKYFYEPDIERLRGLGQMYVDSPDFYASISKVQKGLPEFFNQAIQFYCNGK